jgi:preprotein translocase subunit SecA
MKLAEAISREQVYETLRQEIMAIYEKREQEIPGGIEVARSLERDVMLAVIDQRWREHLSEMDSLREGINLRAMGQQDPLVAWQREGFAMFSQLVELIDDDYLKYLFHVELVQEEAPAADLSRASYFGQNDPVVGLTLVGSENAMESQLPTSEEVETRAASIQRSGSVEAALGADGEATILPFKKSSNEKVGRNEPCWCGSGQKFKNCHGKRDG